MCVCVCVCVCVRVCVCLEEPPHLSPQISMFSKEMFILLSTEDSAHYMVYTFFFYNQLPASSECM